ncbi:MAG: 8-amino-7-oxononanoate synthase [Bacteroidota bacterium]
MNWHEYIDQRLTNQRETGKWRALSGVLNGVDFCSNDYLGLANSAEDLIVPARGSTGSRLISGDHSLLVSLENRLAKAYHSESALLFPSGYMANMGLLSCLPQRTHTILYDRLIHASLRDGIRLSGARAYAFGHNDMRALEKRLHRVDGPCWVVTESVFSMDGDQAPLLEMAGLCQRFGAALIVDEAHALGWLGPQGRGLIAEYGLESKVAIRVLTFGKGPGAEGAVILGSEKLRSFLVNFSRPFIYSTAPGPAFVLKLEKALDRLADEGPNRAEILRERIRYFRQGIPDKWKANLAATEGPIQILHCPGAKRVMDLETHLRKYKIAIRAIRHPTVAEGAERLRICLHTHNTKEEIDLLNSALSEYGAR